MNSHLNRIQNWPELAKEANWSVARLAELCGVSIRTLETHFRNNAGKAPKRWLLEHRQKQAMDLLCTGWSVKEVADALRYKHATHFAREFKKHWGFCPGQVRSQGPIRGQIARFGHIITRFGLKSSFYNLK